MTDRRVEIYYPEDTIVSVYPKPGKYLKNDYARYFLDEILDLAVDKDLSGNDLRVLLVMMGNIGYDNLLNTSHQELGKQLNIDRAAVSRAIKKFVSKGYLQVIDTIGRKNIYQFNPAIVFRSRAKNYKNLCRAWEQKAFPSTQKSPVDLDSDIDLGDKLDDKVSELSEQFGVTESKVRQIVLSLVDQALEIGEEDESDLPY